MKRYVLTNWGSWRDTSGKMAARLVLIKRNKSFWRDKLIWEWRSHYCVHIPGKGGACVRCGTMTHREGVDAG